jgi:demethylmenaquinone methyltransferase / 2-methoxy-6-polyprenyl-1,4-benzoquinol methylase
VTGILPSTADKPRFVSQMFARIAPRYDLMNSVMTFGQDARWRQVVADAVVGRRNGSRVILDVGTGTGRLACAVLEADPSSVVVGVDFTLEMLRRAPHALHRAAGDAVRLPFADRQFDAVISGFVVRNLADVAAGIAEQIRVLRPGGLLVILETTPGPDGLLKIPYRFYFRHLVPVLGLLLAGDASAYTYLPESTLTFLEPTRLAHILLEREMREVETRRLALGSVAVTLGRKPVLPYTQNVPAQE